MTRARKNAEEMAIAETITLESVLSNITYYRIHSYVEQLALVNLLPSILKQDPKVRSVSALPCGLCVLTGCVPVYVLYVRCDLYGGDRSSWWWWTALPSTSGNWASFKTWPSAREP